jgi:hypothetical protein
MTAEAVAGVLGDGTPYYAPFGEVVADESRVTCHLCGRTFRSVPAHLASHGSTKERYCEAFGLERGQSLEGAETRKLRAASLAADGWTWKEMAAESGQSATWLRRQGAAQPHG